MHPVPSIQNSTENRATDTECWSCAICLHWNFFSRVPPSLSCSVKRNWTPVEGLFAFAWPANTRPHCQKLHSFQEDSWDLSAHVFLNWSRFSHLVITTAQVQVTPTCPCAGLVCAAQSRNQSSGEQLTLTDHSPVLFWVSGSIKNLLIEQNLALMSELHCRYILFHTFFPASWLKAKGLFLCLPYIHHSYSGQNEATDQNLILPPNLCNGHSH